ncbi:hypothetical protein ACVJGB_003481 [Bradyrhizobium liaoningense]
MAGDVDAGARIFTRMPPAAPSPAIDEPPLPDESSRMASTPICRRKDNITEEPRSLKLPVGLNHSSLKKGRRSPQPCGISSVQPSPSEIGLAISTGNAAR